MLVFKKKNYSYLYIFFLLLVFFFNEFSTNKALSENYNVSDIEVEKVVMHIKNQRLPNYEEAVLAGPDPETENKLNKSMGLIENDNEVDKGLYEMAVSIVAKDRK